PNVSRQVTCTIWTIPALLSGETENMIAFVEQQLREIGAVLPRNSRNERSLHELPNALWCTLRLTAQQFFPLSSGRASPRQQAEGNASRCRHGATRPRPPPVDAIVPASSRQDEMRTAIDATEGRAAGARVKRRRSPGRRARPERDANKSHSPLRRRQSCHRRSASSDQTLSHL